MAKCNNCGKTFFEEKVIYDGEEDMDFCPECGEGNCIDFEAPHTVTIEEIRQTIPHYLDFVLHKDLIAFCVCGECFSENVDFDEITVVVEKDWLFKIMNKPNPLQYLQEEYTSEDSYQWFTDAVEAQKVVCVS